MIGVTPVDEALKKKLTDFFKDYSQRKYQRGETIIWAGDEPPGVIFLESGNASQYDISESGQKIVLNIFKPAAFFPMSWAINKTANKYFFEALSNIECRIAPSDAVVNYLRLDSDVAVDLLSRVYRGTDGLLQRVAELMIGTARSRLILELLISAHRFGEVHADGSINLSVKTTELAQRTGMARETVSRELKKLEKEKIITRIRSEIVIKDLAILGDKPY